MSSYLTEEEQQEKEREQKRRLSRQQIIEHARKSLLYTAFDVKWIPVSAQLVVVAFAPDPAAQLHVQPPLVAVTVAARLPPPHKSVAALGAWVMVLPFAAPQAAAG